MPTIYQAEMPGKLPNQKSLPPAADAVEGNKQPTSEKLQKLKFPGGLITPEGSRLPGAKRPLFGAPGLSMKESESKPKRRREGGWERSSISLPLSLLSTPPRLFPHPPHFPTPVVQSSCSLALQVVSSSHSAMPPFLTPDSYQFFLHHLLPIPSLLIPSWRSVFHTAAVTGCTFPPRSPT